MQFVKTAEQNTVFSINNTLNLGGRFFDLTTPRVMGILNVTPDSFYDGGRYGNETGIMRQVEKMVADGATFIDVGGYSSRPGAADVPAAEELARVVPAVRAVCRQFPEVPVSIDTFRSEVAAAAVAEGAAMINDISAGGLDPAMPATVASLKVPYIIMHMRGTPQTMHLETDYLDPLKEITDYFHQKIHFFHQLGIRDIVIDPGFGFAKTPDQGFALLAQLEYFRVLGKPLLAGLSRKSMIWKTLGITAEEALNGTTVLNTLAVAKGAGILRVHDVREAVEVIRLLACVHP